MNLPEEYHGVVSGSFDQNKNICINYNRKIIFLENSEKLIRMVEAVPKTVEVKEYFSQDKMREFSIWWESNLTQQVFVTRGTINQIGDALINSGFTYVPEMVKPVLASTINLLIEKDLACFTRIHSKGT